MTVDEVIQFPSGTTGTTVSKALDANTIHGYSLDATAGQAMTLTVTGGATVDVIEDEQPYTVLASGSNVTVSPLPYTGSYLIDVYSANCTALSYDLVIDIPAGGAVTGNQPPPASTNTADGPCPNYTDFTTPSTQDWPMRLCQQGPVVRDVQQALKDLGYDVTVDGFFGPGTAAAVGQWRGDGVGELIPADLEFLFPFDEGDTTPEPATPQPATTTPPYISNAFITLTAGVDYIEPIQLLAGDRIAVQLLDADDGTDPTVQLLDPSGASVAFDDDSGQGPLDAAIDVVVASSGEFKIVATSINSVSGMIYFQLLVN